MAIQKLYPSLRIGILAFVIFHFSFLISFAQQPVLTVNAGHEVLAWEFTPDETQLITAGADKTLKIWDVKQQRLLYTFPAIQRGITAISVSPSGKYLLVGSVGENKADSSEILIIDLVKRQPLLSLTKDHPVEKILGGYHGHDMMLEFKFSPDEKYFSCTYERGQIRVFELATGTEVLRENYPGSLPDVQIDFSPDSKRMLILVVKKYKMKDFSLVEVYNEIENMSVYDFTRKKYVFSGSSKTFATVSTAVFGNNPDVLLLGKTDGKLTAYDFVQKKEVWNYEQLGANYGSILTDKNREKIFLTLASASGKTSGKGLAYELRALEYSTQKVLFSKNLSEKNNFFEPDTIMIFLKADVSADGNAINEFFLIPARWDMKTQSTKGITWTSRRYDLLSGTENPGLPVFISHNTLITERLFNTSDYSAMGAFHFEQSAVSWSSLGVGNNNCYNFWSAKNGQIIPTDNIDNESFYKMKCEMQFKYKDYADDPVLRDNHHSVDKKVILKIETVEDSDNQLKYTIFEYDPVAKAMGRKRGSAILTRQGFQSFSADNSLMFFSQGHWGTDEIKSDDDIIIYSTYGFTKLAEISGAGDAGTASTRFSPDGKYAVYNTRDNIYDNKYDNLYIIDLSSKTVKWKFENYGVMGKFWAWSNDNKYLVTQYRAFGSKFSAYNKFNLIDLTSGKMTTIQTPADIASVLFDASSTKLFVALIDGRIMVWDVTLQKEIISMVRMKNNKDFVVVTPDGRFDGTDEGIKNLHYVSGNTIIPLESFYDKFYTPNLWATTLGNEKMADVVVDIKTIKLPPTVSIITADADKRGVKINDGIRKIESAQQQFAITVEVTDQGGGIDEVRIYQNGKLIEGSTRGFKEVSDNAGKKTYNYTINLLPGNNEIKATAFNSERTEAIPDILNIVYNGVKAEATLYVLSVGINTYKNTKYNLKYAVPDADAFVASVTENADNIFLSVQTKMIKNTEATKANILKAFKDLQSKILPQDVFIFYYAGHGVMTEGNGTAKDDYFLVLTDMIQMYADPSQLSPQCISSRELNDQLITIKAQKQLVVLDACQSGGATEMFASRGAAEEKAMAQLARSAGIVVLAAAGMDQYATEFTPLGHGVFTYSIVEGLKGNADGTNNDKKITVFELKAFLEDYVPELTKKYKGEAQYPTGYSKGQDFPIKVTGNR